MVATRPQGHVLKTGTAHTAVASAAGVAVIAAAASQIPIASRAREHLATPFFAARHIHSTPISSKDSNSNKPIAEVTDGTPFPKLLVNKHKQLDRIVDAQNICVDKARAYGRCVASNMDKLNFNKCEKEFNEFKDCVSRTMKLSRAS